MESLSLFFKFIFEAIKNFYEKFLLRDALAKFLPGLIITLCITALCLEVRVIDDKTPSYSLILLKYFVVFKDKPSSIVLFLFWFVFISVSYIIGFCNQTFSEVLGIQTAHKFSKESIFRKIFWNKKLNKGDIEKNEVPDHLHEYIKTKIDLERYKFQKRLTIIKKEANANQLAQRERYVVIKEMSGNMIIPFVVLAAYALKINFTVSLILLSLSIFSYLTHYYNRNRQTEYEEITIAEIKSNKKQEMQSDSKDAIKNNAIIVTNNDEVKIESNSNSFSVETKVTKLKE